MVDIAKQEFEDHTDPNVRQNHNCEVGIFFRYTERLAISIVLAFVVPMIPLVSLKNEIGFFSLCMRPR